MIKIHRDFDAALKWLAEQRAGVESEALWVAATHSAAEVLWRFAVSVSPVITGAYRSAHIIVRTRMGAMLTINPRTHNPRTGVPVIRYAAKVEEKHHIYERAYREAGPQALAVGSEELMERLGA